MFDQLKRISRIAIPSLQTCILPIFTTHLASRGQQEFTRAFNPRRCRILHAGPELVHDLLLDLIPIALIVALVAELVRDVVQREHRSAWRDALGAFVEPVQLD